MANQGCANGRGERLSSFSTKTVRILVEPRDAEHNDAALEMAQRIEREASTVAELEARVARQHELIERLTAKASDLRRHLEIALGERADYSRGDFWARECDVGRGPEVWLLPEGGGFDRFGLRFAGWDDLARVRPELRPVGVGSDETGHYVVLRGVSIKAKEVAP